MKKTKKTKKMSDKQFVVDIEYTVRGTICVEAPDEDTARELAHDQLICPAQGCEIVDWDIGPPTVEEEVE